MTGGIPQVQPCSAPVRSLIHYLTHTHTQTHTHTYTRRTHPGTMPTLSDHQDTSTLRAFLDKERKPYSKAPQPLLNSWQFGLSNSMTWGGEAVLRDVGQWSPTFAASGTGFLEDSFSVDGWQDREQERDGLQMIPVCYSHCALCFYFCYMVTCNEVITQLSIVQTQWEPWACFPTTRQAHLGLMRDPGERL